MRAVRRDMLRRLAEKGKLLGKCDYHFTDDYIFDAENNYGETDWMLVNIIKTIEDSKSGYLNLWESDFRGYGRAYKNEDGTITLSLGYRSYTLKIIK